MRRKKMTPWVRRRRRVYLIFAIVAVLLAPAVAWRLHLKAAVREELAALRAEGIPTTPEELAAWEAQFPALEMIEGYTKSNDVFVALPFEESKDFPSFRLWHEGKDLLTVPYDDVTLAVMKRFVELNGETLRLLRDARVAVLSGDDPKAGRMSKEHSWPGVNRRLLELCCAHACVRAAAGDGAGAAEALMDGLVLLRTVYAVPWSHALPRSREDVEQLMRALASCAGRTTLSEAQLSAIQSVLTVPDWVEDARLSATHDIATMVLEEFSFEGRDEPLKRAGDLVLGWLDRYMSTTMRSNRTRLALIGRSVEEQREVFQNLKRLEVVRGYSFQGPPNYLTVAIAGVEVINFRQKHGRLPESIELLAPEGIEITDFYTGQPFVYRQDGQSFTLYSVDRDLTDDGGDPRRDVVFHAVLPETEGPLARIEGT